MRRSLLLLLSLACVASAALLSLARFEKTPEAAKAGFTIASEAKNPFTGTVPNAGEEQFQFAIVSDRTGSHRAGVFSKAVKQINLLQPEFVMSVGDLIEGQATAEGNAKEWDEFDGYVKQFQMPFFYCPGNHDAQSKVKLGVYKERYGRPYYHFLYKNCLFVVLNSNDPVDVKGVPTYRGSKIGKEQLAWLDGVLKENANPRWTFVFLHHPIWSAADFTESGWLEVEKMLAGRKHNVYCGHLHTYRMYPRNGTNYYQLATTGGGSAMRGVEYGEFDQCVWITMKADGPVMANVVLSGVLPHDLSVFESDETGKFKPVDPSTLGQVVGKVTYKGQAPPKGLQVVFTEILAKQPDDANKSAAKPYTGNARLNDEGEFEVFANRGAAGLKPGRYVVTLSLAPSFVVDPMRKVDFPLPEKYKTVSKSPLKVTVKKGEQNRFDFALTDD